MKFQGKVVIITGSGGDIGGETAYHMAKHGANVSIVDIDAKRLADLSKKIIESGYPKPLSIMVDITKEPERVIDETIKHFGHLDVLVNCAGVINMDSVDQFDPNEYDRVMNVNLRSAIILTKLAVPHLEKTKGNVVNVSSVAGLRAYRKHLSYCISKAGVNQFTRCAAVDLGPFGIRVNAVNPGVIRTQLWKSIGTTEEHFTKFSEETLVGRIGEPSDVSSAIAYLASESFVNGTLLSVDGGYYCKK